MVKSLRILAVSHTAVSLDTVPYKFRLRLFRAAADMQGIPYDTAVLDHMDDSAMWTRATPREILEHVEKHGFSRRCVGRADLRHPYWQSHFEALSTEQRDVLRIIAILRRLGIWGVSTDVLEAAFATLHDARQFENVMDALVRADWINSSMRIVYTPVLSDDFFVSRHTGSGEEPSALARQVLRFALTSEIVSDEWKRKIVSDALLPRFLDGRPAELALVVRTALRLKPDPQRIPSLAGDLLRVGDRTEVLAAMETYLQHQPDDFDAWSWPVQDALSAQKMDLALWAMREFLRGAERHPEWADVNDYDHDHPTPDHVHNYLNTFRHYLRVVPGFGELAADVLKDPRWLNRMARIRVGYP